MNPRNNDQVNTDKAKETVVTLPLAGDLSYNELHATELGLALAFTSALLSHISLAISIIVYAIITLTPTLSPLKFDPNATIYTIQSEPWYYLTSCTISYIATFIIYALLTI